MSAGKGAVTSPAARGRRDATALIEKAYSLAGRDAQRRFVLRVIAETLAENIDRDRGGKPLPAAYLRAYGVTLTRYIRTGMI